MIRSPCDFCQSIIRYNYELNINLPQNNKLLRNNVEISENNKKIFLKSIAFFAKM